MKKNDGTKKDENRKAELRLSPKSRKLDIRDVLMQIGIPEDRWPEEWFPQPSDRAKREV
ncbi:hypothetical protein IJ21_43610 [Paenibacillus sp. 32O-W]|uniref:hypothetical protein n=1 Tax=Paenibacillus sp. 32O-W TaxID=1695218 RepID=UPI000720FD37|nr:hypothetical protein [Paenibacillus sp. 32O-W]ALS29724.1 hypothetical protein IJ21_43610 [Paenibacillus sp. 32O-W]